MLRTYEPRYIEHLYPSLSINLLYKINNFLNAYAFYRCRKTY